MNQYLSLNSIYTIHADSQLNSFDRKIISALYQPIIGHQASSLYFTLWSELEIDKICSIKAHFKRLCKIMSMDITKLSECFDLLEALGLIRTFFKDDKEVAYYHFLLYSPQSSKTFFSNPLLVSKLKQALGNDDFKKTKMFFQVINNTPNDYEEISKQYKDVYSLAHDPRVIVKTEQYKDYKQAVIKSDFDFNILKDLLKQVNLQYTILDQKVKQTIEMLYLTYKLTTNDIYEAIIEASSEGVLDLNELSKIIEIKNKIRKHKTVLDLVYLKGNRASNKYENNSVFEFIKKYCKSIKLTNDLLQNVEQLMKEYELNTGVCNLIIEEVISANGYLKFTHFKAIAKSWHDQGITTINQAKKTIKEYHDLKRTKPNRYQNNKTVIGSTEGWYEVEESESTEESDNLKELREYFSKL